MRTMMTCLALTLATPAFAQARPPAAVAGSTLTYIHAGRLLDRPSQPPRMRATIVIRDGRIVEVRDGFVPPEAGARLIDLADRFVLPGLIDMHVHLLGIGGDPLRARLDETTRDVEDDLVTGIVNARATLMAGFTTVRDLGGNARSIRALRDATERGDVDGPTIVNAGRMISITGGHGDGRNGLNDDFAHAVEPNEISVCDGPEDCRRAVRRQVGLGAQVIKFAATGGVLSNVAGGLGQAMTAPEMVAIVETAHGLGRRAAAHSHAAAGTATAVAAGADTIEHGTYLDDATIAAMKAKGVVLVPTMLAPATAVAQARRGDLPPATIPKAEAAAAAAMTSHAKAIRAGVKVAFGTDTGVSRHGDNAQEFALMVRAGMSPAQAIRAATVVAAEALGREGRIGTIEAGKDADIIAVDGDPLTDVTRLERVAFVMRHGVVFKAGGERQAAPQRP